MPARMIVVMKYLGRRSRPVALLYVVGFILCYSLAVTSVIGYFTLDSVDGFIFLTAGLVTFCVAVPAVHFAQEIVAELRASKTMLTALVGEIVLARDDALRADRFKSQFVANLSHELRTPLNSIIGFSQLLQRQAYGPLGDARYLSYIDDINLGGQHLLDLINDILALSKIESGMTHIEEGAEADVDEIISDAIHLIMPLAEQRKVSLAYSGALARANLMMGERMLRQIILNILSNAVKFTEADGFVRVSIEHRVNGDLVIYVHDTGIGMSPDDIEIAMTPFGQIASRATGASFEHGTGLGLPLVKAMMDLQQATLYIDSIPGDGTIVGLIFPAKRVISNAQIRRAHSH